MRNAVCGRLTSATRSDWNSLARSNWKDLNTTQKGRLGDNPKTNSKIPKNSQPIRMREISLYSICELKEQNDAIDLKSKSQRKNMNLHNRLKMSKMNSPFGKIGYGLCNKPILLRKSILKPKQCITCKLVRKEKSHEIIFDINKKQVECCRSTNLDSQSSKKSSSPKHKKKENHQVLLI